MSPEHVAIVMDGNRRWASLRNLPPVMGHWEGAEAISTLVRSAKNAGVKTLTLYSFSTENWERSPQEIDALMHVLATTLRAKKDELIEEGVRLDTIGNISALQKDVIDALDETREATMNGSQIHLVLALNYGGRDEIRRVALSIAKDVHAGSLDPDHVTENLIAQRLDTAKWGDPDLLIRTSGEFRVSNFLLWQISYAEVYFTNVLWPDFSKNDLLTAIDEYNRRSRRHGE
jgi:undecaprenyl diphosphate synthase